MAELFVKQVDSATENTEASEVLDEGDLITLESGGGAHRTDPASDDVVDGIVPHRNRGPHLPEHQYDFSDAQYESGTFPVPFYELEDKMDLYPRTVRDDAAPAPSIDINDVVGVVFMDGSDYGSGRPVVVEEGYEADPDNTGGDTTYNRSNNNFLALGLSAQETTAHSEQVKVRVRERLTASR